MAANELRIPALLPNQQVPADAPHRFKLVRAGRRWGKTRLDFYAAVMGHGPHQELKGLLQGMDVVWLAPTNPQADVVWTEEIQHRMKGIRGISVNETKRYVLLEANGARLWVRSNEAIEGIRGIGSRLGGVVVDEGAHIDLQYAIRTIFRPALIDNRGWMLITSSPKRGSYFNQLCEETVAQVRGAEWGHWHGTGWDNPIIPPDEMAGLVEEYRNDPDALREEIYGELLAGGGGLAFKEWRTDVHVRRGEISEGAAWWGGLDWGYANPGAFVLIANTGDRLVVRWDLRFKELSPEEAGILVGHYLREHPDKRPEWIAGDSAMWAVSDGGPTVAESFQKGLADVLHVETPPLIAAPKGRGSRIARKMLLHQQLAWEEGPDGRPVGWKGPKMLFHPDAAYCVSSIPKLILDPHKPEDVETEQDDHAYDALTYALMAREPEAQPHVPDVPLDRHPGYRPDGLRRRRARDPLSQALDALESRMALGQAERPGGRYGMREGLT